MRSLISLVVAGGVLAFAPASMVTPAAGATATAEHRLAVKGPAAKHRLAKRPMAKRPIAKRPFSRRPAAKRRLARRTGPYGFLPGYRPPEVIEYERDMIARARPFYALPEATFYRGRWNGGGFGPCYTYTPIGPVWNCGR